MRLLPALAFCALLCGCQLALPGPLRPAPQDAVAQPANPITGGEIAVTALDAAPPTPTPVPAPVPEVLKSAAQLACEKQGGRWSMAGSAKASFCQTPTGDFGKSCRRETDCDGYCLAKSGTCAPYTPLFGCNEILDASGRLITQCLN